MACSTVACSKVAGSKVACSEVASCTVACSKVACSTVACSKVACSTVACSTVACSKVACSTVACSTVACTYGCTHIVAHGCVHIRLLAHAVAHGCMHSHVTHSLHTVHCTHTSHTRCTLFTARRNHDAARPAYAFHAVAAACRPLQLLLPLCTRSSRRRPPHFRQPNRSTTRPQCANCAPPRSSINNASSALVVEGPLCRRLAEASRHLVI